MGGPPPASERAFPTPDAALRAPPVLPARESLLPAVSEGGVAEHPLRSDALRLRSRGFISRRKPDRGRRCRLHRPPGRHRRAGGGAPARDGVEGRHGGPGACPHRRPLPEGEARNGASGHARFSRAMKRLSRNFLAIVLSDLGRRLLGFFTIAYLARRLGPSDFGAINIGFTILSYAGMAAMAGLGTFGARAAARGELGPVAAALTGARFVNSMLMLLVVG